MGKDIYNSNEEIYSELISDLKHLPKIKTPDNFEYNLMIKIQNGNFSDLEKKSSRKMLYWVLAPTSVVASIVLLFLFDLQSPNIVEENLLMANPILLSDVAINSTTKTLAKSSMFGSPDGRYCTVLGKNDVVTRRKAEYKFDQSRSVAVDNYIGSAPAMASRQSLYQVGGTQSRSASFDGFHFIGNVKQKELLKLKARRDSLINVMKQKSN